MSYLMYDHYFLPKFYTKYILFLFLRQKKQCFIQGFLFRSDDSQLREGESGLRRDNSKLQESESVLPSPILDKTLQKLQQTLHVDYYFLLIEFPFVVVRVKYQIHFEFHNHFDDPNEEAKEKSNIKNKMKNHIKLTYFFPRYGPIELKTTSNERGIKPGLFNGPIIV